MKHIAPSASLNLRQQVAIRPVKDEERILDRFLDLLAEKVANRIQPAPASGGKLLVTLKEAGVMIGRSPGAVGQLVKRGELRAIICGRRIHLQTKEIEEWIERCKR